MTSATQSHQVKTTTVDGQGMWRAWKRGFTSNVLAFKDLIDNAVDAAFDDPSVKKENDDFIGRIHINPDVYQSTTTGICLQNNCLNSVASLEKVFVVYESSKVDSGADAVGENGVGLKQACAALSDLSFVLVKRANNQLSFGVIAESLQLQRGVRLPSFNLVDNGSLYVQLEAHLQKQEYADVRNCIARYGAIEVNDPPSFPVGMKRICEHFQSMNRRYVGHDLFQVIMDRIRHQSSKDDTVEQVDVHHEQKTRVHTLMRDIKKELPKTYLHIPENLYFLVGNDKLSFKHWPQRLVEFSSFTVKVNPNMGWNEGEIFRANDERHDNYELRIFCGFDADRATIPNSRKECMLHLHSRKSGRLICTDADARTKIHLPASGSDYSQGLTIIMDDLKGQLPLNPTKQGVAFGEERRGRVHEENLYQLVGAVVHYYYNLHLKKFKGKTQLMQQVCTFGDWANRDRHRQLKSCQESNLTTYRVKLKKAQRRIRVDSTEVSVGEDTLCLTVRTTASREKKRKSQTNAAAERRNAEPDLPTTKRRRRAAPGSLREAEASADEEEEVEEMRVPRRKAAKNPAAKRGEQAEKNGGGLETVTMKKSDYEELLREKEKLQRRFDEADKLLAPILEGNRKLKAVNTALKADIKELKAINKALSKKRK
eukprot:CAMPEP_0201740920 /NCGR_PEP_ID=MMETSP0593-20130828/46548_1 /ASSEMBLY_ACC=CAM_ASM_000672 /TAXON_ID=267983 /ORGANISM="Skeletonema japonicum, Strain CCMP2506" /LENGTH=653 /DNA_ID=CAMNT_0048235241 /DNA_START=39 /DNA_END=2000 /DNA_ORIENTATION=+